MSKKIAMLSPDDVAEILSPMLKIGVPELVELYTQYGEFIMNELEKHGKVAIKHLGTISIKYVNDGYGSGLQKTMVLEPTDSFVKDLNSGRFTPRFRFESLWRVPGDRLTDGRDGGSVNAVE